MSPCLWDIEIKPLTAGSVAHSHRCFHLNRCIRPKSFFDCFAVSNFAGCYIQRVPLQTARSAPATYNKRLVQGSQAARHRTKAQRKHAKRSAHVQANALGYGAAAEVGSLLYTEAQAWCFCGPGGLHGVFEVVFSHLLPWMQVAFHHEPRMHVSMEAYWLVHNTQAISTPPAPNSVLAACSAGFSTQDCAE